LICFTRFQESGHDGPVQTLQQVIQKLESDGMIDFTLGGHEYTRPADVVQGRAPDRQEVIPTRDPMVVLTKVYQVKF